MTTEEVLLKRLDEGVLTLTMNRPDRLNALTWRLMRMLREEIELAAADPAVRVVILTGAGKGFCPGGDIYGGGDLDADDPISKQHAGTPVWKAYETRVSHVQRFAGASVLLHTMPKPTIAMVRGAAAGAGVSLAAACDLRVVSDNAFFTTAFVKAARSGDYGGSYLLPRLVGPAKARELYLLGERVDAAEALRIGLVNKVVADVSLEEETMKLARKLADGPPAAYRYIKRNLAAAETQTLEQVIELEIYNMQRCSATEDAKEMFLAAKEKRKPVYKGY
jgi:2-(1,2-epoxy-1,2-dihydrophenyl)acetyl-CoA isomerase